MLSPEQDRVVTRFLHLFGLNPAARTVLHQGEGLIIDTQRQDQAVILKVVEADPDQVVQLQAQLDWVRYLAANGMNVPEWIVGIDGAVLQQFRAGERVFTAHAYPKFALNNENEIVWHRDAGLPRKLGEFMGQMHRLSENYQPEQGRALPGHWDEGDWVKDPASVLHPSQSGLVAPVLRLRERIARFPRSPQNYGLIHDDLHTGNVFQSDGKLLVIDFEGCHQGWFAAELASALLFRVWIAPAKERPEMKTQACEFLRGVIQGYRTRRPLPEGWAEMLPDFLKLREISLYQSFYRSVDRTLGEGDSLCTYLYESIWQEKPFLDLDFTTLFYNWGLYCQG
jgi:amicoumacin kinase